MQVAEGLEYGEGCRLQVMGPALCQNLLMSVGCPLTAIRSFGGVEAREYFNILWGLGLLCFLCLDFLMLACGPLIKL